MNAKSYNQAVNDYSDRLLRFIIKNLNKDVETAKDIVQNSYETLWKKRADVPMEKAKAFLFQVAHNQIVDIYRKSGRIQYVEKYFENDLKTEATQNDHKEIMHQVLSSLPTLQRSMVLLKDYEGYSYAEIADILSTNEGQVKINLYRARKKMKDLFTNPLNKTSK